MKINTSHPEFSPEESCLPQFADLLDTVTTLRGPGGCPWDKRQTAESLKKYLHSELEELLTAIDNKDETNICEELGDLLFLIVMVSEIKKEESSFTLGKVIQTVNEKLIRRHPHVFAEQRNLSEEELRKQWKAIKAEEKAQNNI